jgi:hypothetical protein
MESVSFFLCNIQLTLVQRVGGAILVKWWGDHCHVFTNVGQFVQFWFGLVLFGK